MVRCSNPIDKFLSMAINFSVCFDFAPSKHPSTVSYSDCSLSLSASSETPLSHTAQENLAGHVQNLGIPELSTAYGISAAMAPMLAHMTLEAALPQYLEAAPQTCPRTVAAYHGYDG